MYMYKYMYMYMYIVYLYVRAYVYAYVYTHIHMYVYISYANVHLQSLPRTRIYTCIQTLIYIHSHAYVHTFTSTLLSNLNHCIHNLKPYIYIYIYIFTCINLQTHTHTHTHIHTKIHRRRNPKPHKQTGSRPAQSLSCFKTKAYTGSSNSRNHVRRGECMRASRFINGYEYHQRRRARLGGVYILCGPFGIRHYRDVCAKLRVCQSR